MSRLPFEAALQHMLISTCLFPRFRSPADFEPGDLRLLLPRFYEENFPANIKLADQMKALAAKYNVTSAQLALAWILAEHPNCAFSS